jgi:hypothetical protein
MNLIKRLIKILNGNPYSIENHQKFVTGSFQDIHWAHAFFVQFDGKILYQYTDKELNPLSRQVISQLIPQIRSKPPHYDFDLIHMNSHALFKIMKKFVFLFPSKREESPILFVPVEFHTSFIHT